ncbi:MAG: rifamycin-inactivating phosphotransferase [Candidatus Sericytochromatia bacterium]
MSATVLRFDELNPTQIAWVGGKAANLGVLANIPGLHVPEGFCVTTRAFARIMVETPALKSLLAQLAPLTPADRSLLAKLCAEIRAAIEATPIPDKLQREIAAALAELGENHAYAVRSSATAEDLPQASFAGQQDSYLNIRGQAELLTHISRCWASLFSERAVIYRLQNGFDHRQVQMAVLVQKMVLAEASGVLFTAEPVTGKRSVQVINAGFGLGEALVSGLVSADTYQVQDDQIVARQIARKQVSVYALASGGTQTLPDAQILELARLGRQIEALWGTPQDIEWAWANGLFYILQSRPITTLFPLPQAQDTQHRVYLSVGHQQMMTDALKPLGMSIFLLTTRAPMLPAGGRLFVDCTPLLASPARKHMLLEAMAQGDPLMHDALVQIDEREGFILSVPDAGPLPGPSGDKTEQLLQTESDPERVTALLQRHDAEIAALKQQIHTHSGLELLDFIQADLQVLQKNLFELPHMQVIQAAMDAATWLNEKLYAWLGEKKAADTLSLSVPHNITSQMGLALLDVADVIRPFPEVIAYLPTAEDATFLEGLTPLEGGQVAQLALSDYLNTYGMRCAGEIDITTPRWLEQPTILVPLLLGHIAHFAPQAHQLKFEQGRQTALAKEREVLQRLQTLPDGTEKVRQTQHMIRLLRHFSGYREYPKYMMICRYFIYKQALLKTAQELVQAAQIQDPQDIFYLSFQELRALLSSGPVDQALIRQRQADQALYAKLTPPRVMTSDGEIITGRYTRAGVPAGALPGIAVSAGVVEGRARVVLKLEEADLEAGDILVTRFTDPGWTPLFVGITGLVTEVGGVMTHGAVIAREYGLPAVVSVEQATTRIQDGQRIRVNGTEGYVEILDALETICPGATQTGAL